MRKLLLMAILATSTTYAADTMFRGNVQVKEDVTIKNTTAEFQGNVEIDEGKNLQTAGTATFKFIGNAKVTGKGNIKNISGAVASLEGMNPEALAKWNITIDNAGIIDIDGVKLAKYCKTAEQAKNILKGIKITSAGQIRDTQSTSMGILSIGKFGDKENFYVEGKKIEKSDQTGLIGLAGNEIGAKDLILKLFDSTQGQTAEVLSEPRDDRPIDLDSLIKLVNTNFPGAVVKEQHLSSTIEGDTTAEGGYDVLKNSPKIPANNPLVLKAVTEGDVAVLNMGFEKTAAAAANDQINITKVQLDAGDSKTLEFGSKIVDSQNTADLEVTFGGTGVETVVLKKPASSTSKKIGFDVKTITDQATKDLDVQSDAFIKTKEKTKTTTFKGLKIAKGKTLELDGKISFIL